MKTCGAVKARFTAIGSIQFTCDREPHTTGSHRAYDEQHDEVVFWPAAPLPGVWQPIETADKELDRPYDERRTIMLFKREHDYSIVGEGRYFVAADGGGWIGHAWFTNPPRRHLGSFVNPTHWMFKPEPPALEGQ